MAQARSGAQRQQLRIELTRGVRDRGESLGPTSVVDLPVPVAVGIIQSNKARPADPGAALKRVALKPRPARVLQSAGDADVSREVRGLIAEAREEAKAMLEAAAKAADDGGKKGGKK